MRRPLRHLALVILGVSLAVPSTAAAGLIDGPLATPGFIVDRDGDVDPVEGRRQIRDQDEAGKRRKDFAASAAGEWERHESREAHRGLSDAQAVKLLTGEFAAELRPSEPDAETLFGGDRPQFLSDFTARLVGEDGKAEGLIDSQAPLRVQTPDDPGGSKETTDYDLVPAGRDAFCAQVERRPGDPA